MSDKKALTAALCLHFWEKTRWDMYRAEELRQLARSWYHVCAGHQFYLIPKNKISILAKVSNTEFFHQETPPHLATSSVTASDSQY
uniref:Uncharacterized protein n=1 Tax=Arion vulgaris TaxID=1028688 RepID=A0A0B7BGT6_9EUPU